jgi:hydrogenase-4 component E
MAMDPIFSQLTMTGASAMLLCALVVLWRRRVAAYVGALRWQSMALGFVGGVVAWRGHAGELYLVAALIVVLKGIAVPLLLRQMAARFPAEVEAQPLVNTEASLLIAGGLAVVAYEVSRPLTAVVNLPTRGGLPLALALILVSLFVVVSRRKALTQIVGFLMLENGIALLALLGAYGVPLVVELGVFLDVLLGVLVMQVIVYRIHETFDSVDADHLDRLGP